LNICKDEEDEKDGEEEEEEEEIKTSKNGVIIRHGI